MSNSFEIRSAQADWEMWIAYFQKNAANLMPIEWHDTYQLTGEEKHRIASSVQQFQLGESSEGKHLLIQAERYVAASGDKHYLPALRHFIAEERRHSQCLARFMEQQAIPTVQSDTVDTVFRFLRRAFSLELSIMAMFTAEIMAMPYYKSLHNATACPILRQICRQVLRDEVKHLQFQVDTLNTLRAARVRSRVALSHAFHHVLLLGTILIVWHQHKQVLKAGGYSFSGFWHEAWRYFKRLTRQRKPVPELGFI